MKYTTLLLDLDETLFDFSKSEKFAIDKLMEKYNIPVTEENRRLYSKINDEKWKKLERGELTRPQLFRERFDDFFKKTGVTADTDEANLSYMQFLSQASFILDGALETCKKLSGRNKNRSERQAQRLADYEIYQGRFYFRRDRLQ